MSVCTMLRAGVKKSDAASSPLATAAPGFNRAAPSSLWLFVRDELVSDFFIQKQNSGS